MFAVLIDVLLPIAVVVLVGFVIRRLLPLDVATLNRMAIYGFSPALIFVSLVRTDVGGGEALRMIVLSVGVVACMALITLVCTLPFGVRGRDLSAMLLAGLFMNTGNYGLPASRFAFGDEGLQRAILFFIPQAILSQTLGVAVATAGSMQKLSRAEVSRVLRRVLRMPQIYAVALALAIRRLEIALTEAPGLAGALFNGVALLSEAALPFMLTILGAQLAQGVLLARPGLVALATGLRLLVSPLVAFGLGTALGLDGLSLMVAVLQAAMPTAVNTTILAFEFDAQPALVVATVVVSTLGSLLTLSVILTLMR